MNFWKRYPADYKRKTARLTLAQHGAYTLLLDELYTSEQSLPADLVALFRICSAMDKGERDAVKLIAERFFPVGADGSRHNKRATEELVAITPKLQAARENGLKGGRPKKPKGLSKTEPSGDPLGSENKTQKEPTSKPPSDSQKKSKEISASPHPAVGEGRFLDFWESWPNTDRKVDRKKSLAKWRSANLDAHADEILAHLTAIKATRKWLDGYEPAPLRYLNGEQWKDGIHTGVATEKPWANAE